MNLEQIGSIDLVKGAWYLVKLKSFSRINPYPTSGYVIAQAHRNIKFIKGEVHKYLIELVFYGECIRNDNIDGLIKLEI